MKKQIAVLILASFIISACSSTTTPFPEPSSTTVELLQATVPAYTQTSKPTHTKIPSRTPIPLTPTLEVSRLVTFTPAPYTQCPATDESIKLSMGSILREPRTTPDEISTPILNFLNKGGSLMAAYDGLNKDPEKIQVFVLDLTNDRTPELLLQKFPYLFIFGCDAGKYKIILQLGKELGDIYIYALQDYNRNGVPEIIFRWNTFISPFHEPWYSYYFLEWDGDDFKSILTNDQVRDDGLEINNNSSNLSFVTIQGQSIATDAENRNTWEINDYDNNGLKDIRIVGGLPESDYRSRQVILTLSWNGKEYSPSSIFHKAVFRIDVVQDADAAFLLGNYEQALSLYAEVIQNENLLEWGYPGDEKYDRFTFRKIAQAYAYYRIMLTHAVQGNPDDALINYNALRTQFANDEKTKPYVEMSTRFWDDYQSTMDVASACAQVVNYVKANPDMLLPFTIAWNEEYQPKGFCPVE